MPYICNAVMNFDRFINAEFWENSKLKPLQNESSARLSKNLFSHRTPLNLTIKLGSSFRGFFTSIAAGDTDRVSLYQASPDQREPMPWHIKTARKAAVDMLKVQRGYFSSTDQMSDAKAEQGRLKVAHSKRVTLLVMQYVKYDRIIPNLVSRAKELRNAKSFSQDKVSITHSKPT